MKKILVSVFILFLFKTGYSQKPTSYQSVTFLKGDFNYYISNYLLQKQDRKYDSLCIRSCAFISFVVTGNGSIDSIACNISTPKLLSDLFIAAIASTTGLWKAVDQTNSKKIGQRFILPIAYLLSTAGKAVVDRTHESVMTMLDFSMTPKLDKLPFVANNLMVNNCILLSPVYFGSPIY